MSTLHRLTALAAIGILAASGAASCASAEGIEPGLWKIAIRSVSNHVIGPPQESTRCLTADQAKDVVTTFSPVARTANSTCAPIERQFADQKLTWHLVCTGQLNMDLTGEFHFDGRKALHRDDDDKGGDGRADHDRFARPARCELGLGVSLGALLARTETMHTESIAPWVQNHSFLGKHHARHERRTWIVVIFTAVMMVTEIAGGAIFGSMALVADGWHMGTHVAALAIAGFAYLLARRHEQDPALFVRHRKIRRPGGIRQRHHPRHDRAGDRLRVRSCV